MSLSLWLSRRLSGNTGRTSRTGKVIAVLGVTFAIAVMEITLAVTSGFKKEITYKLENFIAPLTITSSGTRIIGDSLETNMLILDDNLVNPIKSILPKAKITPVTFISGMIKTDDDFLALGLKGYEDDYKAEFEKSNLKKGRWISPDSQREIVLSEQVSQALGLSVGDKVNICFFAEDRVKARPFEIVGIYSSGLVEFDKLISFTSASALRKIVQAFDNQITSLEVHDVGLEDVPAVENRLNSKYFEDALSMGNAEAPYRVNTVLKQGALYLNWLDLLDTNVVVIFILMSLVAVSTLISSLFIQVLEKINAIGLLRAIGMTNKGVGKIFEYLTLRLVGWGLIIGNVLGLGLIIIQSKWHIVPLNPEMYYLDSVPIHTTPLTIVLLNVAVILVAWTVLILPARIATRRTPASTLRFD